MSLLVGLAAPAAAAPTSPAAQSPAAGAGQAICIPDSQKINEISGLVATATGYVAINDSASGNSKSRIFTLDAACKIVGTPVSYPSTPLDPEDLAVDKNGTLWIADIGDNTEAAGGSASARPTVAVWNLPQGAKAPVINRLAYPDGKKRDAEALLLSGDGTPIIITKDPVGEIWVPEGPLQPNTTKGVKLKQVGTFAPQETKTANPLAFLGWKAITGAASSPDGTRVVIRTYSDAYEFDVQGGEVVKAITSGKPRITPLPNEARGEAITYSTDGKQYITASDVPSDVRAPILKYTPQNVTPGKGGGAVVPTPKPDDRSFLEDLTLQDITYMVAAVGVLGLILVVAGIVGIRRSRAGRRAAAASGPVRGSAPAPRTTTCPVRARRAAPATCTAPAPPPQPPAAPHPAAPSTAAGVGSSPTISGPRRMTSPAVSSRGLSAAVRSAAGWGVRRWWPGWI
ncbi:SdiA-regulated/phytase-like domain-containing protein [Dactylosporangium cerinum]